MKTTEILVVGGGPAGLSAAIEAASLGCDVTLMDSDLKLGGQLIKQTHKFFGSRDEFAGTRGFEIGNLLFGEVEKYKKEGKLEIFSNTTVTGYYKEDGIVSYTIGEETYDLIKPRRIVMATGAQEKRIAFRNNDLPGVYGAGAVQTLMNVYGVAPGEKVLMIGAGNIGLIVSYQLMQAGVKVAGVVEAMPRIGGYWVHAAKIRRLGVPVYLQHTITEALGDKVIEGAVIQEIDNSFNLVGEPIKVDCDTICMAIGLTPTCELLWSAGCEMKFVPQLCGYVARRDAMMRTSHPDIWVAGDAAGIEEASAAMVEGRIAGLAAAASLKPEGCQMLKDKSAEYLKRLENLRAGETGAKIRCGLEQVCCECWG